MADDVPKGTVTALSSVFPPDEAERAARRVHATIADRRTDLDRLRAFAADNAALLALVHHLPDELSHDVMVPFGPAAFFPGRLVHTNELLVLLGEGYYADRTARQTVEILRRRGEALEAQVATLDATVKDLEAEARFFDSTATEAADGLVEIREEYLEEPQKSMSESDNSKMPDKDAEYARILSRLDELEKEEEAEVEEEEEDEEEEAEMEEEEEEDKEEEEESESASGSDEDEDAEAGHDFSASDNYAKGVGSETSVKVKSNDQDSFNASAAKSIVVGSKQHLTDQSSAVDLRMQLTAKDSYRSFMEQLHNEQSAPLPPEPKENLHTSSDPELKDSSDSVASHTSKIGFDGRKAFTGSIVEHTHGLLPRQSAKPPDSNSAKPVSRFKLQRGNR